jgi:hypothetical protein
MYSAQRYPEPALNINPLWGTSTQPTSARSCQLEIYAPVADGQCPQFSRVVAPLVNEHC